MYQLRVSKGPNNFCLGLALVELVKNTWWTWTINTHLYYLAKFTKRFRLKSKEPPQTFVPKILVSWYPEWVNFKRFLEPKSIHWTKNQKLAIGKVKIDNRHKNYVLGHCTVISLKTAKCIHLKNLFTEIWPGWI